MNWPTIGGYRLTLSRVIFLALVVLDVVLLATRSGAVGLTFILVVWGGWELFREAKTRLLWKVRNRLMVTYVFIAVVPIALILALGFVAGYLLIAQTSAYLVETALDRRNLDIERAAKLLVSEAPQDRLSTVQQLTAIGVPDFEALVKGDVEFRYPAGSALTLPPEGWKDYTGVVYRNGNYYLMSFITKGPMKALILRSFNQNDRAHLVTGLGVLHIPVPDSKPHAPDIGFAGMVPPQANSFDIEVDWPAVIPLADWDVPNSVIAGDAGLFTRPSAIIGIISRSEISDSAVINLFYVLAALLGVAWLISLYIGISMTRTITDAVHNLYEGTTTIGEGDFVHRISVKGHDQLADLSRSFNTMAEQLGQFVVVTKEKERLQSEIAIASEVQTRLFPLKPPSAKTVEMLGVCHAARSVSGDYFDYFTAADGELALALGDVAGKGISAALLMASIQSIMRTQLFDGGECCRPADAVVRLNRLLYANTSPEKYATFFFALYNEETRRLNYTNAGHLPPLLIQRDGYRFLDVTGSVVGAFPSLRYEEQSIPMEPGDLLVAYTDGITEPENEYGEDFGAERLAEVITLHRNAAPEKIVEKVLEAVRNWDASSEQADDMTLMIVRSIA